MEPITVNEPVPVDPPITSKYDVSPIVKEPKEADAEVPDTLTRLESIVQDDANAEAFPTVPPFPPRTIR
jgi:hypothetical protein